MKKQFRIRENQRFQEIRRLGVSHNDKRLVVCFLPNGLPYSRFGFSISKRIGNAVVRNKIKRQLRELIRLQQPSISAGWDIVLIARQPVKFATYHQMDASCARLLRRAHLLQEND